MLSCKARRLVLTLDACHTGVEIGRDVADPEFIRNVYELAEGFALIAASTAQQIAQEWQEKEHGVFTYYLLEGLSDRADRNNKRFVTVNDLQTHVLSGLRRWNVEHGGVIQEPTARAEGLGDMILADYRGRLGSTRSPDAEIQPNPFGDTGRISDPKRFFGREELLGQLFEELGKGSNRSLVGETQVGKSSILLMICKLGPERLHLPQEVFIYLDMRNVYNEQEFFEALCYELGIEPCRGFGPFSANEARRFLKYRLEGTSVSFSESQINELLAESGCHPGRLQRAAAELYRRLVMPL